MTRLGVVAALPGEVHTLTHKRIPRGACCETSAGYLLCHSGMGAKPAGLATTALIQQGVEALISWGTATGLHHEIRASELILPRLIQCADGESREVDRDWHTQLQQRLTDYLTVHTGALLDVSTIIANRTQKSDLHRESQCVAADMESGTIARAASEAHVPFIVIRAVVDTSDMNMPSSVSQAISPVGEISPLKVLRNALSKPHDWLTLCRLSKNFRGAQKTLKLVAKVTGHDFLAPALKH